MKEYEKVLKRGNDVQNKFALEYLLNCGRENLLDDNFFNNLQDDIKKRNDKKSFISNGFALEATNIAREVAKLDSRQLFDYIYNDVKELKRLERSR